MYIFLNFVSYRGFLALGPPVLMCIFSSRLLSIPFELLGIGDIQWLAWLKSLFFFVQSRGAVIVTIGFCG